jgi:hypothetical protein
LILRYSEAAKNPFSDEPLLNYSNYRQETPLFLAVESQNLEVVMFLMQAGASAVHPCIRGRVYKVYIGAKMKNNENARNEYN